jgi:hypothetical protein
MKVREAFNRTIQAELEQTRSVAKEAKDVVREARSTMGEVVTGTPVTR